MEMSDVELEEVEDEVVGCSEKLLEQPAAKQSARSAIMLIPLPARYRTNRVANIKDSADYSVVGC